MYAHYTRPVTDQQGNLLPDIQATVYQPNSTTVINAVLYADAAGLTPLTNPYVFSNGIIDFYLAVPQRVRIGINQGNQPVQYYEDVDVLAAGVDGQHSGSGLNSLVLGPSATATGNNSVALGQGASSPGASGTAVGTSASATGVQSVAVGSAAAQGLGAIGVGNAVQASGDHSTAVGAGAAATFAQATALGNGAQSPYQHSTAIGAGATTTGPNQIMMGTSSDVTEIPLGSAVVLSSPNGTRFRLSVDNTGALTTTLA